jgi:oxygen-independent coproporphyrinogen-3 oxidase
VGRLIRDVEAWGEGLGRPAVDTLYLGGGTPSLLTRPQLTALTEALGRAFDLAPLREATLEANPGTLAPGWLAAARGLGWDRISLGVQTLDDELLARLGRIHDGRQGLEALRLAEEAGFARRSADLMLGIPGQNLDRILGDARALVETGLEHLSVYMLDLDKACPLKAQVEAGRLRLPPEEEVADAYEALVAQMPALGLRLYEISNFSREGAESIHNVKYWTREPYLGLGPSAASQMGALRWTEDARLVPWIEGRGLPEIAVLGGADVLNEIPLLGLRLVRGVDWEELEARAAAEGREALAASWERSLAPLGEAGLLVREGRMRRLTTKGMLLGNAVFRVFV